MQMTHRANLKEFSQDIRHPSSARLPESVMTSRKKMSECLQTQRSKSTFGDQLKTQKLTHARRLSEAKGVQCLENHLAKLFSGDLLPLDLDFSKKGNRQGAKQLMTQRPNFIIRKAHTPSMFIKIDSSPPQGVQRRKKSAETQSQQLKNTTEESKLSRFKLKKDPTESRRVRNPAICRVAFSKKLPFEFNMQLDKENKLSIDLNYSKIVCSGQEEFISSDSYKDFIGLLD